MSDEIIFFIAVGFILVCLFLLCIISCKKQTNKADNYDHLKWRQEAGLHLYRRQEGLTAYGKTVRLELHKGCITQLSDIQSPFHSNKYTPTEAIVNFVYYDQIYDKNGILEAAGDPVKQEYDEKRLDNNSQTVKKGVVITGAGNLPSQAIFHVTIFQHPGKIQDRNTHSSAFS